MRAAGALTAHMQPAVCGAHVQPCVQHSPQMGQSPDRYRGAGTSPPTGGTSRGKGVLAGLALCVAGVGRSPRQPPSARQNRTVRDSRNKPLVICHHPRGILPAPHPLSTQSVFGMAPCIGEFIVPHHIVSESTCVEAAPRLHFCTQLCGLAQPNTPRMRAPKQRTHLPPRGVVAHAPRRSCCASPVGDAQPLPAH
jgi:hypothetical protein